jgi:cytoskeletal protein CcmA (bactofilin family)
MSTASPSAPKRRLLDKLAGSPTFLGEGTRFIGDIEGPGPFVLCGHIQGDGRIDGSLNLTMSGHWEGNVHVTRAVVAGRVTGSLTAEEKLELGKSAVIRGSVTAKTLAIAQGAVIDGDITVTGDTPITRFEEKRIGG